MKMIIELSTIYRIKHKFISLGYKAAHHLATITAKFTNVNDKSISQTGLIQKECILAYETEHAWSIVGTGTTGS